MLHMIVGSTGAGKTTYSMKLETALPAVRFSIDEWMMDLFWADAPAELSFDWAYERVERCGKVIHETAARVSRANGQAVIDTAFTTANERQAFYDWATAANVPFHLHFIDVPQDVRWQRVLNRNAEKGATHAFDVDRGMFDFVENRWERPTADELAKVPHTIITD